MICRLTRRICHSSLNKKSLSPFQKYNKFFRGTLSVLNSFSALGGFAISATTLNPTTVLGLLFGVTISSFSASAFNQITERRLDRLMERTKLRPIPSGDFSVAKAKVLGGTACCLGLSLLYFSCNPLSAALGALTIASYIFIYTPLKVRSQYNTHVGAIVGAIPPLIGVAAACGTVLRPESIFMFTTLFLWQMHHFKCIVWKHRNDYTNAGYKMGSLENESVTIKSGFRFALSMYILVPMAYVLFSPAFGLSIAVFTTPLCIAFNRFKNDPTYPNVSKAFLLGFFQLSGIIFLCFLNYLNRTKTDSQ